MGISVVDHYDSGRYGELRFNYGPHMHYEWGLAGPGGAWFVLELQDDHTAEHVAVAKDYLRCSQDVVSISTRRGVKIGV